jgi:hypothetical protein
MSDGDIFTALSVVVAGLAALLAAYYSKKSLEFAFRAEQSAANANDHAHHANVLSANSWLDQYMTNVRAWADDACDAISIAIHALKAEPSKQDEMLFASLQRVSGLIDRGRWFFPNLWSDEYGQHKEPAYRGVRQPILDSLVDAYRTIETLRVSKDGTYISELVHHQRAFVSEVQQVLNPRRRELEIERIEAQFAISEKLRDANGPEG